MAGKSNSRKGTGKKSYLEMSKDFKDMFGKISKPSKEFNEVFKKMNAQHQEAIRRLKNFGRADYPSLDLEELRSALNPIVPNPIVKALHERDQEVRDSHKENILMQSNIVSAINKVAEYQKDSSNKSNKVQYAILFIALASLLIAILSLFLSV